MKKLLCLILALLLCSMTALAEMTGGWSIPEETFMDENASDAFYNALDHDPLLFPQCLMATQVVAGVNYAVLSNSQDCEEIIYVYHSVSGENQVMRRQRLISFAEDDGDSWSRLGADQPGSEGFMAILSALRSLEGIRIRECRILGQQLVNGVNYAVLCRIVTAAAEPSEGWVLVIVNMAPDASSSVVDLQAIALSLSEE